MKSLLLSLLGLLLGAAPLHAGEIVVSSTRGDDRHAGTAEAPFRSISQALKQAREWRRLGAAEAAGGIVIRIEGGRYLLTEPLFVRPEDSGTAQSPTILRGDDRGGAEPVLLTGGAAVTGWKRVDADPRPAASRRGVLWVAEAPRIGNRLVETRQLWVDGRKTLRASQFAEGVMERMIGFDPENRTITIPTPQQDLSRAEQLEMIVHQRWAIALLRVRSLTDLGNGTTRVTFHDPESRLEFEHPWPQPVIDGERGSSSFVLTNAIEWVDEPGEWFQAYPSGRIYYCAGPGQDPNASEVIVPTAERLVTVAGTRERRVEHISFENLGFVHAAWLRPSHEGHVTLQGGLRLIDAYKLAVPGLPEKAELENQAWIARPEAAVKVDYASTIRFRNCRFRHLGATALDLDHAVHDSAIEGCDFTDIGGTAILLGTFPDGGFETHVPYRPAAEEELCSRLRIAGNRICDATNEDWGCVGIGAGYVRDTEIVGNEVAEVNYSGICIGWGWTPRESGMRNNRILDNRIHHFARRLYDAGGIYTLSNQPGSEIRGNRISDLCDAPYATNDRAFYIYFDEATDGFTVEENCCDADRFGYNRPGPQLVVRNNRFLKP